MILAGGDATPLPPVIYAPVSVCHTFLDGKRGCVFFTISCSASAGAYFDRTATVLFPFPNLVFDLLALFNGRFTLRLDCGMMDKYIVSTIIGNDKTVSFLFAEPFYCSCTHVFFSLDLFIGLSHNILVFYWEYALEELRDTLHRSSH